MVRSKWFLIAVLLAFIVGGCAQKYESVPHNPIGFDRMAHPEVLAYLLPDGTVTKQFIAHDVSGGNVDGSFINSFTKYFDPGGESVIFDEYGPGCLYRQQMNIWRERGAESKYKIPFGKARIRYYFDNESTPRIDMTIDELFGAQTSPFTFPLSFLDGAFDIPGKRPKWVKRFANTYYPLPFEKRLKVTFTPPEDWSARRHTWYQYTYLAFPTAEGIKTWTGPAEDSPLMRQQWSNLGLDPKPSEGNISFDSQKIIPVGMSETIFDHRGQSSIAALKFKLEPFNQDTFFNTNISIYWDNQESPSVSLPIGYFFGGGGKNFSYAPEVSAKIFKSLLYGFDCNDQTFYSYWPMPFWSRAKIKIENRSKGEITLTSHIELRDSKYICYPRNESGYFYAKRTLDYDKGTDAFCNVFNETGRGHAVGISFFTEDFSMDGDEFTHIDSSRTPQIHGNGTEDDHNQGWGGSGYQMPLWGGLIDGYRGAYRVYLGAPYIFYDNIKINYEYSKIGGTDNSKSDVVMFYYKSPSAGRLKLTDELDVGDELSERSHKYRNTSQTWEKTVTSCYDGYEKKRENDCLTDNGRAFNGFSEFTVAIDPANNGVKIRKRVSRFENGLQTATVYVDGKKVTERPWHLVQPSTAPETHKNILAI